MQPVLSRLIDAVSAPVIMNGATPRVTASFGITFYPQAEDVSSEELIRQADQAMYNAKQSGKNRISLFHEADVIHDKFYSNDT